MYSGGPAHYNRTVGIGYLLKTDLTPALENQSSPTPLIPIGTENERKDVLVI
jgi:hypothetical protein